MLEFATKAYTSRTRAGHVRFECDILYDFLQWLSESCDNIFGPIFPEIAQIERRVYNLAILTVQ